LNGPSVVVTQLDIVVAKTVIGNGHPGSVPPIWTDNPNPLDVPSLVDRLNSVETGCSVRNPQPFRQTAWQLDFSSLGESPQLLLSGPRRKWIDAIRWLQWLAHERVNLLGPPRFVGTRFPAIQQINDVFASVAHSAVAK
jgi:hypothetical protein